MQTERSLARPRRVPWMWIGLAAAILLLITAGRLLPLDVWIGRFNAWISGFGAAGVLIYALAYAAATVLFAPGSLLTIGAGFVFGIVWGTVTVSMGAILGAALAFLIARYLARDRVLSLAHRNEKFAAIDRAIGKEGWKIVLLLRLSPLIPFNLSNYLYGLTAVPFWHYVLASWVGMIPGSVLYVYLGVAGKAGLEAASGSAGGQDWLRTAFLAVGLIATVVVTWFVSRVAARALRESDLGEKR